MTNVLKINGYKYMKSRAAIALSPGKPLVIDEVTVEGPKAGEVLIRMIATGVCHTDAFTLSGLYA